MSKKNLIALIASLLFASLFAEQPYWWDNPHKDDQFAMYERGMTSDGASEQDAIQKAVLAAKTMLVERIGILPALQAAGISASPEYAIVNIEVADSGVERNAKKWFAWVLLKYPQEEKQKVIDRWNASLSSISELKKQEAKIPVQFGLTLRTADGTTQYRDGDQIAFTVGADENCYLLLLDHQSDGTTVLLFPNRFHPDGFIRKGETVTIPSQEDASFKLLVGEPYGDDRIEAIAATGKNSLYAKYAGLTESLPDGQNVAVSTRGIFIQGVGNALASQQGQPIKWSRAELSLSTYSK